MCLNVLGPPSLLLECESARDVLVKLGMVERSPWCAPSRDKSLSEASFESARAMRRSHLRYLFLAVGFDMLAIGLIVPLISPFSRELGAC